MAEMHIQDFAEIMRRAWQKAFTQWKKAGLDEEAITLGSMVIALSFVADAAEEYAREPCNKCGFPQYSQVCTFPGHIQCIQGRAVAAVSRSTD
jgi:hypothetical protein